MNTTYPPSRGIAGRRAGRFVILLTCAALATACALNTPNAPGEASPAGDQAQDSQQRAPQAPDGRVDGARGPSAANADASAGASEQQAQAPGSADEKSATTRKSAVIPEVELTGELLYQILASEIAAQRGEYGRATATYLQVARETRDPRAARRATELALTGRSLESALTSAELWHELDPGSDTAAQTLETLLLSTGRFARAEPLLAQRLAQARSAGADQLTATYERLQGLLGRVTDRSAALDMLARLAEPDARLPAAHLALAAVAAAADRPGQALAEAQQAMTLAPGDQGAAIAAARYAQQGDDPKQAETILDQFIMRNPDAIEARFMLARLLMAGGDAAAARRQFEAVLARRPDDPAVLFSLAQLAYQGDEPDTARKYLERYVALPADPHRNDAPAFLFLGQIAEEAGKNREALQWYEQISSGEQFVPAVIRRAVVLGRMGQLEEARKLLHETPARRDQDQIRLTLAEAQILRNAGQADEAFGLLGEALARHPDNTDLLYDQAMTAERLDRIDVLERNLRRIITLDPDHAHAYNALGYTLADRGQRLDEARSLIEKALALAPDDAHIEDSMGWVLFRLGRYEEAEHYLRRAWERAPEAEVAAHLGEVLWAQERHDEARQLWRQASERDPDNETLRSTLARLKVKL